MANSPLTPLRATEWDLNKARHLLNRAAFGAPRDRVDSLAGAGPEGAVDALLRYEQFPFSNERPGFIVSERLNRELRKEWKGQPEEEQQRLRGLYRRQERANIDKLSAWWIKRMATSPRPLEEKLALFWHGHFAVSAQKVQSSGAMYDYYELLRSHASGNLKRLTIAVGQSPAMLRYLDNARSTKEHPNENWARELMELFTMGPGHYTENDIKESARAFTGWNTNGESFQYRENNHDWGPKTFLGRTGNFDGWDIIDIIFEQQATAEHFARKLWSYFVYDEPEPAIVTELARTIRNHGYEAAPALRQMFLSQAFYSEKAMGTQIKSPAQLVVELAHDLNLDPPPYRQMAKASGHLGQRLLYPPNVKGWDGNRAWINANSLLQRYNLPPALVAAKPEPDLESETHGMERLMAAMQPAMSDTMNTAMDNTMAAEGQMAKSGRKPLMEALEKLPAEKRREWKQVLKSAGSPKERRGLIEKLLRETGIRWSPAELFAELEFATAGECVDALTQAYLVVPLAREQRAVLMEVLGAENESAALKPEELSVAKMNAALHLLFSTVEYQVC